ncbi:uncharacterized protein SAMN06265222_107255 [Neorhodopirellula lusitana]|uniref:Asparagine synthetase domain-containing protein n=1 Tax=Neorhodopirellula lusitana TaxID=445327 RepID=A0ABY1QC13_9BACT|nr:ATP-dependent sacrificial sulfur transferase LarE [Neorhodopirellula lusitana]SMP62163.1 uncharacterized protein SAMN06265222_107255 [Neorhodopirellula lusitana]
MLDSAKQLIDRLSSLGPLVVAFSGGVDSSVVAAAAVRAGTPQTTGASQFFSEVGGVIKPDFPDNCIAVTARSPSLASWQAELATRVAAEIPIEHRFVDTNELGRDAYRSNPTDRCYYCKETLYEYLRPIAVQRSAVIVSGTNADDLGDHRPGIQAGRDAGVQTPLADLGFGKSEVRRIAESFGLSNADLPASPCLSSRIEYHVEVTPERLGRIDAAEAWLRSHGLGDLRVRLHAGELARIEVPATDLARVVDLQLNESLSQHFQSLGFRNVTLNLAGLRSGSMNEGLVQLSGVSR